jgi:hypothetical protein
MSSKSPLHYAQKHVVSLLAIVAGGGIYCWSLRSEGAEAERAVGRIQTDRLNETSGLAVSRQNPNVLWLHNDGGNKRVFAVTSDGALAASVRLRAKIDDVEDIAIGAGPEIGVDFIYLGDIGDNNGNRHEIRVVRLVEPDLSQAGNEEFDAKRVEEFRLRYPDGPHDAEALMVDPATGDVLIVTKDRRSRLYRVAADALKVNGVATLELVALLNVGDISGGDISRAGDMILLRTEQRGWLWPRQPGEDLADALGRAPRRVTTRGNGQAKNGESIGFSPDGRGYFTVSEGQREAIYYFPIDAAGTDSSP